MIVKINSIQYPAPHWYGGKFKLLRMPVQSTLPAFMPGLTPIKTPSDPRVPSIPKTCLYLGFSALAQPRLSAASSSHTTRIKTP